MLRAGKLHDKGGRSRQRGRRNLNMVVNFGHHRYCYAGGCLPAMSDLLLLLQGQITVIGQGQQQRRGPVPLTHEPSDGRSQRARVRRPPRRSLQIMRIGQVINHEYRTGVLGVRVQN